jgi:hypothetical protein
MAKRSLDTTEETPNGWASHIAKVIAAAMEAREEEKHQQRSRRAKAAKARNRRYGRHQGGRRRFGYRLEPALDSGAPCEIPDPGEQRAMADVLELRQRGVTLRGIVEAMSARHPARQPVARWCHHARRMACCCCLPLGFRVDPRRGLAAARVGATVAVYRCA